MAAMGECAPPQSRDDGALQEIANAYGPMLEWRTQRKPLLMEGTNMDKYFPLMQYLQKSGKSSEFLTFAEIEQILEDSLPPSASNYFAWWANHLHNYQAKGWMQAGWRVDRVSLGESVVFERVSPAPAKNVVPPQPGKEAPLRVILIKKDSVGMKNEKPEMEGLSEDEIKRSIQAYLDKNNWTSKIAWGNEHGIDIDAHRNGERWIIEVKGHGTLTAMRANYFLAVLGELLQRMDDTSAKYSIALPALPQFSNLWRKLPRLAKQKTGISCLFVDSNGKIEEEL
jgi:hypothetical protein